MRPDPVNQQPLCIGFLSFMLALYAPTADAYVGPGLGLGAIAAVLGVFVALLLLVVGLIWYPLKRFIRWVRGKQ